MRISRRLARIEQQARKRLDKLLSAVLSLPNTTGCGPRQAKMAVAYVTMEAHGVWSHFARTYYIAVMLGARSSSGTPVTAGIQVSSHMAAVGTAIQFLRPRTFGGRSLSGPWLMREEPAWHSIQEWLRLLSHVGCSALVQVQGAVSIGTDVLSDLTVFRNYFAHRNRETFQAAQSLAGKYAVSPVLSPAEILLARPPGSPNTVLRQWLLDLETVITLTCA